MAGAVTMSLSSLHTQGKPRHSGALSAYYSFIPAYTGQTPTASGGSGFSSFHPCIHRGTGNEYDPAGTYYLSSLHTQGNQRGKLWAHHRVPFIPAYTGEPPGASNVVSNLPFHPCTHRANEDGNPTESAILLSSLHTQGNRTVPGAWMAFTAFHPCIRRANAFRGELRAVHLSSLHTQGKPY